MRNIIKTSKLRKILFLNGFPLNFRSSQEIAFIVIQIVVFNFLVTCDKRKKHEKSPELFINVVFIIFFVQKLNEKKTKEKRSKCEIA